MNRNGEQLGSLCFLPRDICRFSTRHTICVKYD